MLNNLLIIPDIHGRTFWKEAIQKYPNSEIIFLGDYLDPYPREGISQKMALENFKDIIDFANESDKCSLLLGNHDLHYMIDFDGDRKDEDREVCIKELFINNLSLFSLIKSLRINRKLYVFSHAPILERWVRGTGLPCSPEFLISELNGKLQNLLDNKFYLEYILNFISSYRGGFDSYGSPLWSDIRELVLDRNKILTGIDFNVFGHTHLEEPIITERFACLDTEHAYILSQDCKIITA